MQSFISLIKKYFSISIIIYLLIVAPSILAQNISQFEYYKNIREKIENADRSDFRYIPKKPGHYTAEDWHAIIDTVWGQGRPIEEKLQIFDTFWKSIDEEYGAFHNLDVNWDSLGAAYRDTVENGVSKGRFAGIMTHLSFALKEGHTKVYNMDIFNYLLEPGIPILVLHSYNGAFNQGWFGAGLTPLPDSSLLVYKVIDNHPLGLELGDIVLGYDGIPWKNLYKELLRAQLPVTSFIGQNDSTATYGLLGSSDKSIDHMWLRSAGLNWHLFDSIDVKKYGTNNVQHLSTQLLHNQSSKLICSEQLPPPGISLPDFENGQVLTWGIITNTNIGYITLWSWNAPGVQEQFTNAVKKLVLNYHVNGMIFDYRNALGGYTNWANEAYGILFNTNFDKLFQELREDPNNHLFLVRDTVYSSYYHIQADPYLYDHPIAILSGPTAISAGDINALRLTYHPMAKSFGKGTNCAFSGAGDYEINFSYSEWKGSRVRYNFYLEDEPGYYLCHVGFEVDEEVWLTPDDVAKGEDTVVKRAIEWIQNLAYAHDVKVDKTYFKSGIDSVFVSATIENPNQHNLSVEAVVRNMDSTVTDNIDLFDDGIHGDGEANDNLWGNSYLPTDEQSYKISVTTNDLTEETSRTLPNVAWFTTIGPVVFEKYEHSLIGNVLNLLLYLKNESSTFDVTNISAQIATNDTNISMIENTPQSFGDIGAGGTAHSLDAYAVYIKHFSDSVNFDIQITSDGISFWKDNFTFYFETGISGVEKTIPLEFALQQNYPNPFNPVTMINYQLPMSSDVELSIYNLLGQRVATLVNERKRAGYHQVEWDASNMASGIYLYRFETEGYVETRKMILLR